MHDGRACLKSVSELHRDNFAMMTMSNGWTVYYQNSADQEHHSGTVDTFCLSTHTHRHINRHTKTHIQTQTDRHIHRHTQTHQQTYKDTYTQTHTDRHIHRHRQTHQQTYRQRHLNRLAHKHVLITHLRCCHFPSDCKTSIVVWPSLHEFCVTSAPSQSNRLWIWLLISVSYTHLTLPTKRIV